MHMRIIVLRAMNILKRGSVEGSAFNITQSWKNAYLFFKFMNDSHLFSLQPESPENRQSVGVEYVMEVEVKNVRSTTVNIAVLDIYYPHRSDETGDYFYLLPNCMLDTEVLIQHVLPPSSPSPFTSHLHPSLWPLTWFVCLPLWWINWSWFAVQIASAY